MTPILFALTLRVSVVLLAGLVAATLLHRRSAAARHWVLAVTVVCAACVPAVSMVAPSWELSAPVPPSLRAAGSPVVSVAADRVAGAQVVTRPPAASSATGPSWPALGDVARGLAWLWAAGALLALGVLGAGLLHLARLARAAAPVREGRWRAKPICSISAGTSGGTFTARRTTTGRFPRSW
jgi:hypothetical protein